MKVVIKLVAVMFIIFGSALGTPSIPVPDELVRPSETDERITTFNNPHGVFFPIGKPRGELLLFLPGTNVREKQGPGARRFCETAAQAGYHVVFLMYPNKISAAEACRESASPAAYADFRWTLIKGGETPYINIPSVESIENRLIKLLQFSERKHPAQGWEQFLQKGSIVWEKVAVAGQSQGGGHAALIATKQLVARVLCFGSPRDYSAHLNAPAAWYKESVTPLQRYFAFNNVQDRQGCTYGQLLQNIKALGLDKVAGMADVDKEVAPYHHARALFTGWPGHPTNSQDAHGSMLRDSLLDANGAPLFQPVWRYMLMEPTNAR